MLGILCNDSYTPSPILFYIIVFTILKIHHCKQVNFKLQDAEIITDIVSKQWVTLTVNITIIFQACFCFSLYSVNQYRGKEENRDFNIVKKPLTLEINMLIILEGSLKNGDSSFVGDSRDGSLVSGVSSLTQRGRSFRFL